MKNFITSNFNLLHSNNNWENLKKKYSCKIDQNYNNFYFAINNNNILNAFENIHIILYIKKNNFREIKKKNF